MLRICNLSERGFTIIELLVTVSIIAILIAILVPSLEQAMTSAERAACGSNMRGIGAAVMMYGHEQGQRLPPGTGNTTPDGTNVRWFGGMNGSRFVAEVSPLYSYWGSAKIGGCPSLQMDGSRTQYGPVDYAYSDYLGNSQYVPGPATSADVWAVALSNGTYTGSNPPPGVKRTRVANPNKTAMVFDSAFIDSFNFDPPQLSRLPWGHPPSFQGPDFHGRHGGVGNIVWVDGHVDTLAPVWFASYGVSSSASGRNSLGYNSQQIESYLKPNFIGDVDEDGNQQADELMDLN